MTGVFDDNMFLSGILATILEEVSQSVPWLKPAFTYWMKFLSRDCLEWHSEGIHMVLIFYLFMDAIEPRIQGQTGL